MSSSRSKRSGKSGRKRAGTDVDKSATKILRTDSGASSSSASSIGDAFIGNDARRDLRSSRSGKPAVTFPADGNGNPASPVRRPPRTTASASPNKTAHDHKENDTVANNIQPRLGTAAAAAVRVGGRAHAQWRPGGVFHGP